jgi:hypothetical protein
MNGRVKPPYAEKVKETRPLGALPIGLLLAKSSVLETRPDR